MYMMVGIIILILLVVAIFITGITSHYLITDLIILQGLTDSI